VNIFAELQMSHNGSRRDRCAAAGVTDAGGAL